MKKCILKAAEILCPEKQSTLQTQWLIVSVTWRETYSVSMKKGNDFVAYSVAINAITDITDRTQLVVFMRTFIYCKNY